MSDLTFHVGDIVKRKEFVGGRQDNFVVQGFDPSDGFIIDDRGTNHSPNSLDLVVRQLPLATTPMPESGDPVEQPSHYITGKFEAIEVIEAFGLDRDFRLGNAAKYLLRAGKKDSELQDLQKARQYLNRYINALEGTPAW